VLANERPLVAIPAFSKCLLNRCLAMDYSVTMYVNQSRRLEGGKKLGMYSKF
jgi:hypothetical protein